MSHRWFYVRVVTHSEGSSILFGLVFLFVLVGLTCLVVCSWFVCLPAFSPVLLSWLVLMKTYELASH